MDKMATEYQMALWGELNMDTLLLPEHQLLLAIVERSVLDYVGPAQTPLDIRRAGAKFFLCKEDAPFSFLWICNHLPFDPDWFRVTILRYVKREREKRWAEKRRLMASEGQNGR